MNKFQKNYIENTILEFHRYKILGDKTFQQLSEKELHWKYSETDNSIAQIVKHISSNMLSRWTNFLEEDGEKPWRDRENEFKNPPKTKNDLIQLWETGWQCLFSALYSIKKDNLG